MPEGRRANGARGRLRALPSPSAKQDPVEPPEFRGRQKLALIRDLAMSEWDPASLARRYQVTEPEIAAFAEKYQDEIIEVGAALSGTLSIETASLWVARKQDRLAEFQQGVEDIDAALASLREQGHVWTRAHRDLFRARLDLYRQIAEELGAYPQRQAPPVRTGNSVTYVIESEDSEALQ